MVADDEDLHRQQREHDREVRKQAERRSDKPRDRGETTNPPRHASKDSRHYRTDDVPIHPYKPRTDQILNKTYPGTGSHDQLAAHANLDKRRAKSQTNLKASAEAARSKGNHYSGRTERQGSVPALETTLISPYDRPKTAGMVDSSDLSYATPVTASTGRMLNYASTAVTSAAMTPARPSQRGSQQIHPDDEAQIEETDADTAEWMRRELEKRLQHEEQHKREADVQLKAQAKIEAEEQVRRELEKQRQRYLEGMRAAEAQPPRTLSRSNSRARNITADIKDFVLPGRSSSRAGSRPPSRNVGEVQGLGLVRKPSFTENWRSWGFQRQPSKSGSNDLRREFSAGQKDDYSLSDAGKQDVDLNRKLPPLPGLDTWKDPEQPKEEKKKEKKHIAKATKTTDIALPASSGTSVTSPRQTRPQIVTIPARVERREVPKIHTGIANRHYEAESASPSEGARSHPSSSHSKDTSQDSCFTPATIASPNPANRSIDLVKAAELARQGEISLSPQSVHSAVFPRRHDSLRYRKQTGSSMQNLSTLNPTTFVEERRPSLVTTIVGGPLAQLPTPGRTPTSSRPDTRSEDPIANFSRKISHEQHVRPTAAELRFPVAGEITALPPMPHKARKPSIAIGLRRVLSTMGINNSNGSVRQREQHQQRGWMNRVEAEGVRGGVLVQNEAARPAVRY